MFLHKVLRRKRRIFQGNFSPAGFTFLEIVISLSLISVGMLLYLEIFNTAMDAHSRSIREIISTNLAQGLMAEIMSKNFEEEPGPDNPPLGPDSGETGRFGGWDDVDDYSNPYYDESPGPPNMVGGLPMDGLGTPPRPNYAGFFRRVTEVINVDCTVDCGPPATPCPDYCATSCPPSCDYKRVTLQVTDPRGRVTQQVGVKVKP